MPCGPLYAIDEIFRDPQYAARENIKIMPHPVVGEIKIPNVVPRLTETPGAVESLGPELGQHTDEILSALLGLSATQIAKFREQGVV